MSIESKRKSNGLALILMQVNVLLATWHFESKTVSKQMHGMSCISIHLTHCVLANYVAALPAH